MGNGVAVFYVVILTCISFDKKDYDEEDCSVAHEEKPVPFRVSSREVSSFAVLTRVKETASYQDREQRDYVLTKDHLNRVV